MRRPTLLCGKRAVLLGLATVAALMLAPADPVRAQDRALEGVEQLTADGRYAQAREELAAWFESAWDRSSRDDRQRALWLRGRLTVDAGMAERDYRRLVVEYPGGSYSDEALLRLAQLAWARSDTEAALRHLRMLARDYPESEHRAEALELSARLGGGPGATGTDGGTAGQVSPAAPGAMQTGVVAPSQPPPRTPATAPTSAPESFDGMQFTIELGAFSTEPPALAIANAALTKGVEIRMVGLAGSDLIHVRTGAFFSQMEAQARALEMRLNGIPASVMADRAEEEPR